MYKVLKIEKYDHETFFTLKNLKTGEEIECFEALSYEDLEEFHFIKEGGIYEILICMGIYIIEAKEWDNDNYYKILELNKKIGDYKFAKLELNNNIYYVLMKELEKVKDLKDKEKILLRQGQYSLLKVDNTMSSAFYTSDEERQRLKKKLEKAKWDNNKSLMDLYTELLKQPED